MAAPDFNAEYQNTLAGIQLAEEKGLEGIGHPAENGLPATGRYKSSEEVFNEGQEAQKANEPGVYRGIDARSNRGGILTSGFESRRVHGQEGVFERQAKQRLGSRTRAERGYEAERGGVIANAAQNRIGAQNRLSGQQREYALENPPFSWAPQAQSTVPGGGYPTGQQYSRATTTVPSVSYVGAANTGLKRAPDIFATKRKK